MTKAFWKTKTLNEMNQNEWESLCDGCGLCCLHKLQDVNTREVSYTGIACELLNCNSCRCSDYQNRFDKVDDCVQLSPDNLEQLDWLPETCAYRLIADGEKLYDWHHLISGSQESVHEAGISARSTDAKSEADIDDDYWKKLEQKLGIKILKDPQ